LSVAVGLDGGSENAFGVRVEVLGSGFRVTGVGFMV